MSTCPLCHRDVIRGHLSAEQVVLLEPGPAVYIAIAAHTLAPEDGARVCRGLGMVEHAALCGARKEGHDHQE